MSHPRSSSFTVATRRTSTPPLFELKYDSLWKLFNETLGDYCLDKRLRLSARNQFHGMTLRHESSANNKDVEVSREELDSVVSTLSAILDQSPQLPPHYVASVHGFVGVANALNGKHESAVASFLKALWLETSSMNESGRLDIGLLLHRLGVCYHNCGDKEAAYNLLGKALKVYDLCGLSKDSSLLMHAREEHDLLGIELSTRAKRRAWQSTPNILVPTNLTTIEEQEDQRRQTYSFENKAPKTHLSFI